MNPLSERLRLTKSDSSQTKETPKNINVFGGLPWLRGLDLNQRPSGYEFRYIWQTGVRTRAQEYDKSQYNTGFGDSLYDRRTQGCALVYLKVFANS